MNAQQAAPSGTSIFAQHSFRESAIHIESRIAHSKSGGNSHNKNPIAKTVSIVFDKLENKFFLSQPKRPISERGGGSDCCSMSFRGVDETQNWTKVEQNVDESWKWLQESHQITKS